MDGGRKICRLLDTDYPAMDNLCHGDRRNLPLWELIPFAFADLNSLIRASEVPTPPLVRSYSHDC